MKFPKSNQGVGAGNFFKLKDGENKTGVLRGEPYRFFVLWEGGKSVLCEENTKGRSVRYRVNIVVFEEGKFVSKIWEISQTVCNQLADLNEEYALETINIKISRRGSGTDTEYGIIPLLKEPLSPNTMSLIEACPLQILEQKARPKDFQEPTFGVQGDVPNFDELESIPF